MRVRLIVLMIVLCCGVPAVFAQESTPEVEIALTETLTSSDGSYTVSYPEDWFAAATGVAEFTFANTEEGLDHNFDEAFKPGEALIGLLFGTPEEVVNGLDVEPDADIAEILQTVIDQALSNSPMTFGEITTSSIADRRTATSTISMDEGEGYISLIDWNDTTMVVLIVVSASGEQDQWLPVAVSIAESLTPTSRSTPMIATAEIPPLTEFFSDEETPLTVSYPEGWVARPSFPNSVDVASSEAALDLWLNDEFASGDAHLWIGYGSAEEIFETLPPEALTPVEMIEFIISTDDDSDDRFAYSDPEAITIGGHDAAFTRVDIGTSATYVVLIDYDDVEEGKILAASIQTASGELDDGEALLLAMLETVEVK